MPSSTSPTAILSPLPHPDGSATYTTPTTTLLASLHAPIEVSRRDELPSTATLEILLRPSSGVSSTRERHLESILSSTLRHIVLISQFPRTLIQLTIQVVAREERKAGPEADLELIPALLQVCMLALLDAGMPLASTVAGTLVAICAGKVVVEPNAKQVEIADSIHVLGFSGRGELLVNESQGSFSYAEWCEVFDAAKRRCCDLEDEMVDEDQERNVVELYKSALREKVEADLHWKG